MLQIELDQSSTLKLISQLYPTEELLLFRSEGFVKLRDLEIVS